MIAAEFTVGWVLAHPVTLLVFGVIGVLAVAGIAVVLAGIGDGGQHKAPRRRHLAAAAGAPGAARRVILLTRRAARSTCAWFQSEMEGLADWPQDIETTLRIFEEMCAEDTGGLRALHSADLDHHELPVAGMVATESVARAEDTPVKHPLPGPDLAPGAGVSLSPVTTATCPAGSSETVKADSPAPEDPPGRDGKRPEQPADTASGGQHDAAAHATETAGTGHPAGGLEPDWEHDTTWFMLPAIDADIAARAGA